MAGMTKKKMMGPASKRNRMGAKKKKGMTKGY